VPFNRFLGFYIIQNRPKGGFFMAKYAQWTPFCALIDPEVGKISLS
jgi:hypothetical protein